MTRSLWLIAPVLVAAAAAPLRAQEPPTPPPLDPAPALDDPTSAPPPLDGDDPVRRELDDLRRRVAELEARHPPAGAEPIAPEEEDPGAFSRMLDEVLGRVRLSGYAVVGYEYSDRTSTSLRSLLHEHRFRAGDLSLYLRASLPHDFAVSLQLLFEPRPQDNVLPQAEDFEIERAFVQWAPLTQLRLRLGKWITPVGYWTYLVHDEPLLPTLTTPLVIRNRIFPEEGTGLVLEGEQPLGAARVGYAAWLSNGEVAGGLPEDHDKAVGGRLYVVGEGAGAVRFWQVGVSAYTGKTPGPREYDPGDPRLVDVALAEHRAADFFQQTFEARGLTPWGEPIDGHTDRAVAGDVVLDLYGLRVRAELMVNWVRPRSRAISRYVEWGAYLYVGYAFELPSLTRATGDPLALGTLEPYVRVDRYDSNGDYVDELQSLSMLSLGATYSINQYVQVRVESTWYRYPDASRDFYGLQAGVVGAF